MRDKDFQCRQCKSRYQMHQNGEGLPSDWCENHTEETGLGHLLFGDE